MLERGFLRIAVTSATSQSTCLAHCMQFTQLGELAPCQCAARRPSPAILTYCRSLCSIQPFARQVAETIEFSVHLTHVAQLVIARLARKTGPTFNGLHLRVEEDARDWALLVGGDEVRLSSRGD